MSGHGAANPGDGASRIVAARMNSFLRLRGSTARGGLDTPRFPRCSGSQRVGLTVVLEFFLDRVPIQRSAGPQGNAAQMGEDRGARTDLDIRSRTVPGANTVEPVAVVSFDGMGLRDVAVQEVLGITV